VRTGFTYNRPAFRPRIIRKPVLMVWLASLLDSSRELRGALPVRAEISGVAESH